jgi:DNA-binding SARP family transcriptional activator/nucleoid-associated protein YgaU
MHPTRTKELTSARSNAERVDRLRLLGFLTVMLVSGIGLGAVGGAPRLPDRAPRLEQLAAVLAGSTLPVQPLSVVLLDLAWLMWAWIVGSLGLEVLVVAAEGVGHGAAWAQSFRRLADRVTFPLARRAVAAVFAVQILSRGVPLAAAQPLTPAEIAMVAETDRQSLPSAVVAASDAAPQPMQASYVVRAGDTLWSIADQAYGSGAAYRRLVDANVGRRMPDGRLFTAQGVIHPGWELVIPEPEANLRVSEVDGQRFYTVGAGDTLSGVAAEILGDDTRWSELFELNRGATSSDGTHTLTDPNVIWPGLRLLLPPAPTPPVEAAEPAEAGFVAATAVSTAASPPRVEASSAPVGEQSRVLPPEEVDPLPLVRTLHALDPIALEPADVSEPDAGSTVPDAVSSPSDGEATMPTTPEPRDFGMPPAALGGIGLVALAGVALGARRLRRLRPLPHEPESEVVVEGGFAEAQLAHDFTRGLHGVGFDPLVAVVDQLQRFLDEYNLGHIGVVALRHGRSATTLTLSAGLAEQPILVDLAPAFAARLEADAEAWVSSDQDVVMRLVRVRKTRLLAAADAPAEGPCLVPLGVLYDRQVYMATCTSLGHVLIASLPGHGAEAIVTSLVATLTARRSPEQLRVWMIAHPRALAAPVFELPHLERLIDPDDETALSLVAEDLRAELDRRAQRGSRDDLVVVIPELTSLGEHAPSFELLANRAAGPGPGPGPGPGQNLGVRFIAASTCPEEAALSPLLGHFGTRMVLRMQHEEASVALLGVADAAYLGGGGRLLLRLDGREPVELYGYHVAPEHLERLVRVMRSAYPSGAAPPRPAEQPDDEQPDPEEPFPAELPVTLRSPHVPAPVADTVSDRTDAAVAGAFGADAAASQPPNELPWDVPAPVADAASERADAAVADAAVAEGAGADAAGADVAPIQVTCFGGPRVVCAGHQVWPRRPAGEAKPWEFLLYLACQPADGVSSEDAVEALWPEDDGALNPGHRFRQLRYRLRHQLSSVPGAPPTDGVCFERGTLRLDPALVYSDAQEFLGLVRGARINPGPSAIQQLERARELYVGDLLEGPDARRYAWVHERDTSGVTLREHFRRLFAQASTRLAEMYAVNGDIHAAIELYRELIDIDPADEELWCALFRLHADRGDRLALVREEHRMRAALRGLAAEVGDAGSQQIEEPSRETLQEYQRLLAGVHNREPEAAAV